MDKPYIEKRLDQTNCYYDFDMDRYPNSSPAILRAFTLDGREYTVKSHEDQRLVDRHHRYREICQVVDSEGKWGFVAVDYYAMLDKDILDKIEEGHVINSNDPSYFNTANRWRVSLIGNVQETKEKAIDSAKEREKAIRDDLEGMIHRLRKIENNV